jgi:hypothetical protein
VNGGASRKRKENTVLDKAALTTHARLNVAMAHVLHPLVRSLEAARLGCQAYATDELERAQRMIHLFAVRQNGNALEHASANMKGDRQVVLAAVQQDGRALSYADRFLQGDREVVLAAVQENGCVPRRGGEPFVSA